MVCNRFGETKTTQWSHAGWTSDFQAVVVVDQGALHGTHDGADLTRISGSQRRALTKQRALRKRASCGVRSCGRRQAEHYAIKRDPSVNVTNVSHSTRRVHIRHHRSLVQPHPQLTPSTPHPPPRRLILRTPPHLVLC